MPVAGVLVSACALALVASSQIGVHASDTVPGRPAMLPTTSVAEVGDLDAGLDATLELAAGDDAVPGNLRPSLPDALLSVTETIQNGCHVSITDIEPVVCNYGDEDGAITAVLIGDSHAAHWLPALDVLAEASGIRLIPLTKSGCSVADVPLMNPRLERVYTECAEWRERMVATVAELRPDIVIASQSSSYSVADLPASEWPRAIQAGYEATLERLTPHAGDVIVLADTPYASRNIPNCLWENLDHATACVWSRTDAFSQRLSAAEDAAAAGAGARYVQPDDLFCGPTMCPVIVGDILVYRDANHITTVYMAWVAPALADLLAAPWSSPTGSARSRPGS
jgi:hypothetical protein